MKKNSEVVVNNNGNNGIGFLGLLTIALIVLKLTGVIDWGWVWVLAPIWIPFSFALLLIIGLAIFAAILSIKNKFLRKD